MYAAVAFVLTVPTVQLVFTKVPGSTTPPSPVTLEVVHVTAPAAGPPAMAAKPDAAPRNGPNAVADNGESEARRTGRGRAVEWSVEKLLGTSEPPKTLSGRDFPGVRVDDDC